MSAVLPNYITVSPDHFSWSSSLSFIVVPYFTFFLLALLERRRGEENDTRMGKRQCVLDDEFGTIVWGAARGMHFIRKLSRCILHELSAVGSVTFTANVERDSY